MKTTSITVRIKRDIRHRQYVVSQCECELTAEIEGGEEELDSARQELHENVKVILDDMEADERVWYETTLKIKKESK